MATCATLLLSSGPIPVFGILGGITGGIGEDVDVDEELEELGVAELELAGVEDEAVVGDELEEEPVATDDDETDDAEEAAVATDEDEEEIGAALLVLALLLAGGATTATVGFETALPIRVTSVCPNALPCSIAPLCIAIVEAPGPARTIPSKVDPGFSVVVPATTQKIF